MLELQHIFANWADLNNKISLTSISCWLFICNAILSAYTHTYSCIRVCMWMLASANQKCYKHFLIQPEKLARAASCSQLSQSKKPLLETKTCDIQDATEPPLWWVNTLHYVYVCVLLKPTQSLQMSNHFIGRSWKCRYSIRRGKVRVTYYFEWCLLHWWQ